MSESTENTKRIMNIERVLDIKYGLPNAPKNKLEHLNEWRKNIDKWKIDQKHEFEKIRDEMNKEIQKIKEKEEVKPQSFWEFIKNIRK